MPETPTNDDVVVITYDDIRYAVDTAPLAPAHSQYLIARNQALRRVRLLADEAMQDGIDAMYGRKSADDC